MRSSHRSRFSLQIAITKNKAPSLVVGFVENHVARFSSSVLCPKSSPQADLHDRRPHVYSCNLHMVKLIHAIITDAGHMLYIRLDVHRDRIRAMSDYSSRFIQVYFNLVNISVHEKIAFLEYLSWNLRIYYNAMYVIMQLFNLLLRQNKSTCSVKRKSL